MNQSNQNNIDSFYENCKSFRKFKEFAESKFYTPLPDDWYVVITDVQGSTKAIQSGKYKEINSLGVASIVAVTNAVKPLSIPFVFGGDGAILCVPESKKIVVEKALLAAKKAADDHFEFKLRVGMVAVKEIRAAGHDVLVGKYLANKHYQQAMFDGSGLDYAERLIKDPETGKDYWVDDSVMTPEGSFDGFECRWNEIPSPHDETITLLVQSLNKKEPVQNSTMTNIIEKISQVYGGEESYNPLRENKMTLTLSRDLLSPELRIRAGSKSFFGRLVYQLRCLFSVCAGKYLMKKNIKTDTTDWSRYKKTFIANTDYRKYDGLLRMVISGTKAKRENLRFFLENLRQSGKIVFGIHRSNKAIVTCMISDYSFNHMHFLDGADGGYAMAAIELKKQLGDIKKL